MSLHSSAQPFSTRVAKGSISPRPFSTSTSSPPRSPRPPAPPARPSAQHAPAQHLNHLGTLVHTPFRRQVEVPNRARTTACLVCPHQAMQLGALHAELVPAVDVLADSDDVTPCLIIDRVFRVLLLPFIMIILLLLLLLLLVLLREAHVAEKSQNKQPTMRKTSWRGRCQFLPATLRPHECTARTSLSSCGMGPLSNLQPNRRCYFLHRLDPIAAPECPALAAAHNPPLTCRTS